MLLQTERYLDLAHQGRNQWWRYALGVFIIALSPVGLVGILAGLLVIFVVLGMLPVVDAERFIQALFGKDTEKSVLDFVGLNLAIIIMLAGLVVNMKLVHRRSLLSLVTSDPSIDWHRIARGGIVWILLVAVFTLIEFVLFPDRYWLSFDAERFFPFLLPVLALTPFQAATEELVFRGYGIQGLGLLTRRPVLIAITSSLVFTALHLLNPEVALHGAAIMAANYFLMSMLLATIVLRDGRLELAIGMHTANNMVSALVANNVGSAFKTESILTSQFDPIFSLVALFISALAFHWWVFRHGIQADGAPRS